MPQREARGEAAEAIPGSGACPPSSGTALTHTGLAGWHRRKRAERQRLSLLLRGKRGLHPSIPPMPTLPSFLPSSASPSGTRRSAKQRPRLPLSSQAMKAGTAPPALPRAAADDGARPREARGGGGGRRPRGVWREGSECTNRRKPRALEGARLAEDCGRRLWG